jgi:hypothetical protein
LSTEEVFVFSQRNRQDAERDDRKKTTPSQSSCLAAKGLVTLMRQVRVVSEIAHAV